mmetsp:Transcript_12693/g.30012  ORF Transcript_12693/g.30012 Transcript_12693/m.30012 type:complete len:92 (-) Transcript_12693:932-1207(-)
MPTPLSTEPIFLVVGATGPMFFIVGLRDCILPSEGLELIRELLDVDPRGALEGEIDDREFADSFGFAGDCSRLSIEKFVDDGEMDRAGSLL